MNKRIFDMIYNHIVFVQYICAVMLQALKRYIMSSVDDGKLNSSPQGPQTCADITHSIWCDFVNNR